MGKRGKGVSVGSAEHCYRSNLNSSYSSLSYKINRVEIKAENVIHTARCQVHYSFGFFKIVPKLKPFFTVYILWSIYQTRSSVRYRYDGKCIAYCRAFN